MPENGTSKSGSSGNGDTRNGPPRLRRRLTRGWPSPLAAVCLVCVAVGLAACAGPASGQAPPAGAGTVSARSAASLSALPAAATSAARSGAAAAASTQPSAGAAASQAKPSTAAPDPGAQPGPGSSALPLAPARLPAFNVEFWTAQQAGPVEHVHGHNIELNECASVFGPATWQQQSYVSRSGGDSAIFETYSFGTSAAARSAYTRAASGMGSCQATTRSLQVAAHIAPDAVARQTAGATGAAAFERTWTGVDGVSAAGPQTNHLYLAVRGTTLVVLHFDAFGQAPAPYNVRNDPAVLDTLVSVLAR